MARKYDTMQGKWMELGVLFAEQSRLQEHINKEKKIRQGLFKHLEGIANEFLSVVTGDNKGIYSNDVEYALHFGRLATGYNVRNAELRAKFKEYLETTFYLGALTHINLFNFPTRVKYKNVSPSAIKGQWVVNAIAADREMAGYGGNNTIVMGVFEQYYEKHVKPDIKKDFNVGMVRIGKYNSYFKNLYLAGAYLVMTCEMATKKR